MNELDILKENFVFISYTHTDMDVLVADAEILKSRGVRVWYDENMEIGDKWTDVAEDKIFHSNCVGVIFYVSPSALASKAVQQEQRWTKQRLEQDPNFRYWFVVLGNNDLKAMYRQAAEIYETKNPDEEYDDIKAFQKTLFNPEILYITSQDPNERVEEIYSKIALDRGCVDNEYSVVKAKKDSIYFGRVKANVFPISALDDKDNGVYEYGNEQVVVYEGNTYKTKPLLWDLLYVKEHTCIYISNQILDIMPFDVMEAYLEEDFLKISFNEEEIRFIKENNISIRLLEEKDVDNIAKVEALSTEVNKHWWTAVPSLMEGWKKTCVDGSFYDIGFPKHMKKGFRPVLEIKQDLLSKI